MLDVRAGDELHPPFATVLQPLQDLILDLEVPGEVVFSGL